MNDPQLQTCTIGELEPANRGPRGCALARRRHRPLGPVLPQRGRVHGAHQVVTDRLID